MADNPLIAFVQFEPDGRVRTTGAHRLGDWPLRSAKDPAMAVEDARVRLVEKGGHYPVMAASPPMGSAAAPKAEVDEQFRVTGELPADVGEASLAMTYEIARRVRRPGLPKPGSQFCARIGCQRPASFDKPLCYTHWKEWDAFELAECARCHWLMTPTVEEAFYWTVGEDLDDVAFHCDPCLAHALSPERWPVANAWSREAVGELPIILAHAPLVRPVRYVYILKLDGAEMYVGQTPNLPVRVREHKDGLVTSTRGKNPRLVYFESYEGDKSGVSDREDELTLLNQSPIGRRRLREMIENFRTPLRLVDLDA